MPAPRAIPALVVLLAPACFSPTGSESATTREPTTDLTTTGPGPTTTTTAATASTTEPVDPSTLGSSSAITTTDPTATDSTITGATETTGVTETTETTAAEPVCGNGVTEDGEQCDDGDDDDTDDCPTTCLYAECGDGFVHAGVEECDDLGDHCVDCARKWVRVFVTEERFTGAMLGGLAGADQKCQAAAEDAGLKGTFRAWLSTDKESAAARLPHSTLSYRRLDGVLVAASWDDLVDGALQNPINVTEMNTTLAEGPKCGECPVWTATDTWGSALAGDCDDWTAGRATYAHIGECTETLDLWTHGCDPRLCSWLAHVYCFET